MFISEARDNKDGEYGYTLARDVSFMLKKMSHLFPTYRFFLCVWFCFDAGLRTEFENPTCIESKPRSQS